MLRKKKTKQKKLICMDWENSTILSLDFFVLVFILKIKNSTYNDLSLLKICYSQ